MRATGSRERTAGVSSDAPTRGKGHGGGWGLTSFPVLGAAWHKLVTRVFRPSGLPSLSLPESHRSVFKAHSPLPLKAPAGLIQKEADLCRQVAPTTTLADSSRGWGASGPSLRPSQRDRGSPLQIDSGGELHSVDFLSGSASLGLASVSLAAIKSFSLS